MSQNSTPVLSLPERDLKVHALGVSHQLGTPAGAEIIATVFDLPDADLLRGWLGAEASLRYGDTSEETWRVARLTADGRSLRITLEGALAQLAQVHSAMVLSGASLLDCACTLLERHGISAQVRVSSPAATTPVAVLVQPEIDDLAFLAALANAGGFCMVDTLEDHGVALIDGPELGHATVVALAGTAHVPQISVAYAAGRPLAASLVVDRSLDRVDFGAPGAVPPSVWPGVSLDPDALRAQLDGRASRSQSCVTYQIETRDTQVRAGWQAEVNASWLPTGICVQGLTRQLDDNQHVRTTLTLSAPDDFIASGSDVVLVPPPAPRCARVVSAEAGNSKGYITVAVAGADAETHVPAQVIAQSTGTGTGASVLPQPDAWVALGFVGDPLMPRPVVLGTLRDASDPPPQHVDAQSGSFVLARTASGAEVILNTAEGGDRLDVRIGDRSALSLGADGTVTLSGDTVSIDATSLTLKGSAIQMEQT